MNWYYDKTKIISIIAAVVVALGGIVTGGVVLDNNAETELNTATEAIYSEMATDIELEEAIAGLPSQQDVADLDSMVDSIQADLDAYIEAQEEQELDIGAILDRLGDAEEAIADIEDDLYGEDGVWELLVDIQRDIDYIWNYIATH